MNFIRIYVFLSAVEDVIDSIEQMPYHKSVSSVCSKVNPLPSMYLRMIQLEPSFDKSKNLMKSIDNMITLCKLDWGGEDNNRYLYHRHALYLLTEYRDIEWKYN